MTNQEEMRVVIGSIGRGKSTPSKKDHYLRRILDGMDEVLMLTDADVKAMHMVLDEHLATMFEDMETQRKRISYLESRIDDKPKKPRGRPKKEQ